MADACIQSHTDSLPAMYTDLESGRLRDLGLAGKNLTSSGQKRVMINARICARFVRIFLAWSGYVQVRS